jgi:hypothetical protein
MTAETAGEDAVCLARARQQIAADNTYLPTWDELTGEERDQSTVAAGWWLEAAKDAGLARRESTEPADHRDQMIELLRSLVDPDDCWFDHHGGCQAHGFLSLEPGEKCPHAEAKELLAALGGDNEDGRDA